MLIAQGVEAGGHVQSTTPLMVLLAHATAAAGTVPVVAAGGLATAADVRDVLDRGAAAAMLGTRFVASRESEAHTTYKRALVAATEEDSRYTLCFDGECEDSHCDRTWAKALRQHAARRNGDDCLLGRRDWLAQGSRVAAIAGVPVKLACIQQKLQKL